MCNLAVKRARECYWAADRFVEDLWIMYSRAAVHYIDVWSIVTQRHHMDSLIWVNIVWGNDFMMTSSNGNSFSVTGVLWGESTDHRWIPLTKASDADFGGVFFYLRLNKRLSNQSRPRWFKTPSYSLWCHCNGMASSAKHQYIPCGNDLLAPIILICIHIDMLCIYPTIACLKMPLR